MYLLDAQGKEIGCASFEEVFEALISVLENELMATKTKVILVPSVSDVHHMHPMPQPPFEGFKKGRFTMVGNPSMI